MPYFQQDNGILLGTKDNVFFEWDPVADTFSPKFMLTDAQEGLSSGGELLQAPNGKLYGMTSMGGSEDEGVLYEWDPFTDTYTKKLDFNGIEKGSFPGGSLVISDDNKLLGFTTRGGTYDSGVLFEWGIDSETYVKKADFNVGENGSLPLGSLVALNKPKALGTTVEEGDV